MTKSEDQFGHSQSAYGTPFDSYVRRSIYLTMSDGVRLALDYFLPTRDDRPAEEPLPVVFQMTPYNRAQLVGGELIHVLSPYRDKRGSPHFNNLAHLCLHGYAIAALDVRGQGASFGDYDGIMSAEEGRDGAEVVAWLAAQPWCSGAVGMLGSSYGAATQFLVAVERPPALKALYAAHIYFDAYDVHFPGGARELSIPRAWAKMVDTLAGRGGDVSVAPVDGIDGPALLEQVIRARRERAGASAGFERILESGFRDGNGYFTERTAHGSQNLATLLPELQAAAIPAYFHGGWNDYYPAQTIRWFANWTTAPARLTIGPWTHSPRAFSSPRDDEDLRIRAVESLRWFDHWLKGIDTGMLDEPAIHYAVQEGHPYTTRPSRSDRWSWRATEAWPPENISWRTLYPSPGPSGTVASINDGRLLPSPSLVGIESPLTIDPTITTGDRNRMGAAFIGEAVAYPDMAPLDARSLTWTGDPITQAFDLIGTPEIELTIRASAADVLVVAWLEIVQPDGTSTLLTYGNLKASHRTCATPPYLMTDEIYRASSREAVGGITPLNQVEEKLTFSLLPTANHFVAGQRLRLTISFSDDSNLEHVSAGETVFVRYGKRAALLRIPVST